MVEVIVQCCERGNRDREVVSPDDRLQICQAAGEWPRSPWSIQTAKPNDIPQSMRLRSPLL